MKDRVKKLCKDQNITLKELAAKMGVAGESLTRALNGNPTLSTIQNIASALGVEIQALFPSNGSELNGFVEYKGEVYRIKSKVDLEKLLQFLS